MNNIRQIITERLENARNDYKYYQGGSSEFYEYSLFEISGQIEAYQDCLNLIPAPRTEADILKDFEKLGYKVVCNNDLRIKLENNGDILTISKVSRWYSCKRYANNNTYDEISVPIAMQEHKLLNELFEVWQWI